MQVFLCSYILITGRAAKISFSCSGRSRKKVCNFQGSFLSVLGELSGNMPVKFLSFISVSRGGLVHLCVRCRCCHHGGTLLTPDLGSHPHPKSHDGTTWLRMALGLYADEGYLFSSLSHCFCVFSETFLFSSRKIEENIQAHLGIFCTDKRTTCSMLFLSLADNFLLAKIRSFLQLFSFIEVHGH